MAWQRLLKRIPEDDAERVACPITREATFRPLRCSDGFTYEEDAVFFWMHQNPTSPMTRQPILWYVRDVERLRHVDALLCRPRSECDKEEGGGLTSRPSRASSVPKSSSHGGARSGAGCPLACCVGPRLARDATTA